MVFCSVSAYLSRCWLIDIYSAIPSSMRLDSLKSRFRGGNGEVNDQDLADYRPHRLSRVDERDETEDT